MSTIGKSLETGSILVVSRGPRAASRGRRVNGHRGIVEGGENVLKIASSDDYRTLLIY